MDGLPPGPPEPPVVQTLEWIARPTDLLRRAAARYGEPFTLRTLIADAPMVVVSDPATVKAIYAAPADVLRGGAASRVLEPFVGSSSVLLLDGEPHLRSRRVMLPPLHGERMLAHRETVVALAREALARWPAGTPRARAPAHAGAHARRDHARRLRLARRAPARGRSARRSTSRCRCPGSWPWP